MKTKWLHKESNEKCIVFFNGWGCDENPFLKMESNDYDVFMCYDYKDILPPKELERLFSNYEEVTLIAWSLGVYVANMVCLQWKDLFAKCMAINGTLQPIDNLKGIPPAIYQGTIDGLNERNLGKFWLRMCGNKSNFDNFKSEKPNRDLTDQKDELVKLQEIVQNHYVDWNIFDSIFLGGNDMIFPFENLKMAWEDNSAVTINDEAPHFCFYLWDSWDDLMKE